MRYLFLNGLFHFFHIALIGFVMIGWLIPSLRTAHLTLIAITLGSWFILGRWLGFGYCPITDWHWKIKDVLGEGRPQGTYIHFILQKMTGRCLNADAVDRTVMAGMLGIAASSLLVNLIAW